MDLCAVRILCCVVVSGGERERARESFSCQLRMRRVLLPLSQSSPWLGKPNTSKNAGVPFQRGNTVMFPFAKQYGGVLKKRQKSHSERMRRLTSRSASLLSYIHLSADKLRIPSLSSAASPLLCLSLLLYCRRPFIHKKDCQL